jgi:hypothetical protein
MKELDIAKPTKTTRADQPVLSQQKIRKKTRIQAKKVELSNQSQTLLTLRSSGVHS